MKKETGITNLSPSTLNIFKECPRCFWLDKTAKIARPRGIFPSLPGGMDNIIKAQFDENRKKGMRALAKYEGALFQDQIWLDDARNWRKAALKVSGPGYNLSGAIDDLYKEKDGTHTPIDYKTRGTQMKETAEDYARKYYQNQMDCYTLMLRENGLEPSGSAVLIFYYPIQAKETGDDTTRFDFAIITARIETSPEAAKETCEKAVECLAGPEPEAAEGCEYCEREAKLAARIAAREK